jgi:orotate phosphoribosyltransferase
MDPAAARSQLLALLRERAVLHGDFTLSSGRRSSYYLDARVVTLSAQGSHLVAQVFLQTICDTDVEAVAGLTLGADPIVASIAAVSGRDGRPIDGLIVRATRKEHGAARRIEGPWRPGLHVAVVDDTFTTGASALEAAEAIVDAGGEVRAVYALIDREQGAREAIESAGYAFHAIFTSREVMEGVQPQTV